MAARIRQKIKREMPAVWIDHPVYRDMLDICMAVNSEVAWFGEMETHPDEVYLITNVSVPYQQASGATVEIEPADLEEYALEYLEKHGPEAYNRLRVWGHSHNTMGVSPSKQDQDTIDSLCEAVGETFVAIRMNQKGAIEVDVAYPDGTTVENAEVEVGLYDPKRAEEWKKIVTTRLRKIVYSKAPAYGKDARTAGVKDHRQQGKEIVKHWDDKWPSGDPKAASGWSLEPPGNYIWDHIKKDWVLYEQATASARNQADMGRAAIRWKGAGKPSQPPVDDIEDGDEPTDGEMEVLMCQHKYTTTDGIMYCVNCGASQPMIDQIEWDYGWMIGQYGPHEISMREDMGLTEFMQDVHHGGSTPEAEQAKKGD